MTKVRDLQCNHCQVLLVWVVRERKLKTEVHRIEEFYSALRGGQE
jgi:hypothetical protein